MLKVKREGGPFLQYPFLVPEVKKRVFRMDASDPFMEDSFKLSIIPGAPFRHLHF